jgi:hypothetical protein
MIVHWLIPRHYVVRMLYPSSSSAMLASHFPPFTNSPFLLARSKAQVDWSKRRSAGPVTLLQKSLFVRFQKLCF